jgi:Protein of unknown function (DUF2911)
MRINRFYIMLGALMAFGLFFEITAHADQVDEATTITFSQPVEIPGEVLPAGTYLFKLADNGSDPNVVQIFNANGTRVYATLPTVSATRENPVGETTITLANQGPESPETLVKWFYPGSMEGHEFMYSAHEEHQLEQDKQETITVNPDASHSDVQAGD